MQTDSMNVTTTGIVIDQNTLIAQQKCGFLIHFSTLSTNQIQGS